MTHACFCVLSALLQGGHKSSKHCQEYARSAYLRSCLLTVVYDNKDTSTRCPGILPYSDYNGESVL